MGSLVGLAGFTASLHTTTATPFHTKNIKNSKFGVELNFSFCLNVKHKVSCKILSSHNYICLDCRLFSLFYIFFYLVELCLSYELRFHDSGLFPFRCRCVVVSVMLCYGSVGGDERREEGKGFLAMKI